MVNDNRHEPRFPCSSQMLHRLVTQHPGSGQQVMQAGFALSKSNHDEADTEKHGRQDLGKEPSCGATKADPVTGFIHHFEAQNSFSDRSLP
jgi:hypothetical protein